MFRSRFLSVEYPTDSLGVPGHALDLNTARGFQPRRNSICVLIIEPNLVPRKLETEFSFLGLSGTEHALNRARLSH